MGTVAARRALPVASRNLDSGAEDGLKSAQLARVPFAEGADLAAFADVIEPAAVVRLAALVAELGEHGTQIVPVPLEQKCALLRRKPLGT